MVQHPHAVLVVAYAPSYGVYWQLPRLLAGVNALWGYHDDGQYHLHAHDSLRHVPRSIDERQHLGRYTPPPAAPQRHWASVVLLVGTDGSGVGLYFDFHLFARTRHLFYALSDTRRGYQPRMIPLTHFTFVGYVLVSPKFLENRVALAQLVKTAFGHDAPPLQYVHVVEVAEQVQAV